MTTVNTLKNLNVKPFPSIIIILIRSGNQKFMTTLVAYFVVHTIGVGFALLSISRLNHYIKRYRFDESKYTLLFGFVHLHWIQAAYLITAVLWMVISFFILFRI